MDDKDTFHTFGYQGGFISTCHNRTKGVEEITVRRYEGDRARPVKSIHAAKVQISRWRTKEGKL